jgi:tetratricopeptide (TPR) repeat protein/tRNA A-37 threonylcarbamoyl transferase component Bud32
VRPDDDDQPTELIPAGGLDAAPTVVTPLSPRRPPSGRSTFAAEQVVAGRYRIVRFIARGGMGEVYEAEDLELQGPVALKTIRPEIADDAVAVERFRREIQIARKVTNPHVCRVFDVDHDEATGADVTFVTMELLSGQTLHDLIVHAGPLSPAQALPIAFQMAEGLAAAHRAGVVHRDFKPANVMLVEEPGRAHPRVVITDFGLARATVVGDRTVTHAGDVVGTPAYVAPEQIEGEPLTPAADVYALGVVLYEMVTRRFPFEAETQLHAVLKRLKEPAVPPRTYVPDLDAAWEQAILHCLERNPRDRPPEALAVVRALEGQTETIPSHRRARTRRAALALAGLAVAGLVATVAIRRPWEGRQAPAPPAAPARAAVSARRAVAVLGFRNQSGQPDVAWLSTALGEMLTTEVAAASSVRTIPGDAVARSKVELGIADGQALPPATLARLRGALGADYLVAGSYAALGDAGERQLRLDLQLREALGGNVVASLAETGTEDRIFDLVSRAGARLREHLGVGPLSAEAASGILASLPANPRAVRYYAEGLAAARAYDNQLASTLLERAVAEDPDFPLARAELATTYRVLGQEARSRQAIAGALERAQRLPRESRLLIEAQTHGAYERFDQAAEVYVALSRFYPDNLDYALAAVNSRVDAGKGKEALQLLAVLAKAWSDPRVDIAEAAVAESLSDYQRARGAAQRAIAAADRRGQSLVAARARIYEAWALLRTSEFQAARVAFEDAKARYEKAGDRVGIEQAVGGIGHVLMETKQLDQAQAIFQTLLDGARAAGSRQGEATALHNIAMIHYRRGDLRQTKSLLERAVTIQRERGHKGQLAATLSVVAGVAVDGGDAAGAKRLYEEALALNEEIGARRAAANNRNNLAGIAHRRGDNDEAERQFRQAMAEYQRIGDEVAVADVLNNLAIVQRAQGKLDAAEKSYAEAEAVYKRTNSRSDLALVAVNVASVLLDRGDLGRAKERAEFALATWRATGERSYAAYALMGVGDVEARRGDLVRAEAMYRDALRERQEMGETTTLPESQLALADLLVEAGRVGEAEPLGRAALAGFEKEERPDMVALAHTALCRAALARGDLAAAQRLLRAADALAPDAFAVGLAEARLATAAGKPLVAIRRLDALLAEAERLGSVPQQLDARLLLAQAYRAAGRAAEAKARFEAVHWDATKKGFGLIARRAQE